MLARITWYTQQVIRAENIPLTKILVTPYLTRLSVIWDPAVVVASILDEEAPGHVAVVTRFDILALLLVHHTSLDVVRQNGHILGINMTCMSSTLHPMDPIL